MGLTISIVNQEPFLSFTQFRGASIINHLTGSHLTARSLSLALSHSLLFRRNEEEIRRKEKNLFYVGGSIAITTVENEYEAPEIY